MALPSGVNTHEPPEWRKALLPEDKALADKYAQQMHDLRRGLPAPSALRPSFQYDQPKQAEKLNSLYKLCTLAAALCPSLHEQLELELRALAIQARLPACRLRHRTGRSDSAAVRSIGPTAAANRCPSQSARTRSLPKPSQLDPDALQLWTAWYHFSGLTPEQAMLEYCDRVIDLYLKSDKSYQKAEIHYALPDADHTKEYEFERYNLAISSALENSFPPTVTETCRQDGELKLSLQDWELLSGLRKIVIDGPCSRPAACFCSCFMSQAAKAELAAWRKAGAIDKAVAREAFVQISRSLWEKHNQFGNKLFVSGPNRFWDWGIFTGEGLSSRIACGPRYAEPKPKKS
ncbi:hypothetical protein AB1Y20_013596 [Prymnesium parvum]|uniref:Uncharacterized protein n=1 Tax=Prymnesium parvum TaxID=97485 RepID=A0AB34IJ40_PRYPA